MFTIYIFTLIAQCNIFTRNNGERPGDPDDPPEFPIEDRHQSFPTQLGHFRPPSRRLLHREYFLSFILNWIRVWMTTTSNAPCCCRRYWFDSFFFPPKPFTLVGALLRDFVFGEVFCKLIPFLQGKLISLFVRVIGARPVMSIILTHSEIQYLFSSLLSATVCLRSKLYYSCESTGFDLHRVLKYRSRPSKLIGHHHRGVAQVPTNALRAGIQRLDGKLPMEAYSTLIRYGWQSAHIQWRADSRSSSAAGSLPKNCPAPSMQKKILMT